MTNDYLQHKLRRKKNVIIVSLAMRCVCIVRKTMKKKKRWTFHNWISFSQIESTPRWWSWRPCKVQIQYQMIRCLYICLFFKYTGTTLFKLINLRFHSHFTCGCIWFQIPSTFRRHVNAMPMVRLLINKWKKKQTNNNGVFWDLHHFGQYWNTVGASHVYSIVDVPISQTGKWYSLVLFVQFHFGLLF